MLVDHFGPSRQMKEQRQKLLNSRGKKQQELQHTQRRTRRRIEEFPLTRVSQKVQSVRYFAAKYLSKHNPLLCFTFFTFFVSSFSFHPKNLISLYAKTKFNTEHRMIRFGLNDSLVPDDFLRTSYQFKQFMLVFLFYEEHCAACIMLGPLTTIYGSIDTICNSIDAQLEPFLLLGNVSTNPTTSFHPSPI